MMNLNITNPLTFHNWYMLIIQSPTPPKDAESPPKDTGPTESGEPEKLSEEREAEEKVMFAVESLFILIY